MRLLKVSEYTKSLRGVIQLKKLLPKSQFFRCYTKAYTYYGGFDANDLYQERRKQTKFIDERASESEKLTTFKAHLAKLVNPIKKYEFLIKLRDYDIDLYYRYLCNNTTEALSVICAMDGISKKNITFFKSSNLGFLHRDTPIQQLDAANAVEYMKRKVDVVRETKYSDTKIIDGIENMDRDDGMWSKKGLMITPEHSYMIYMKYK